MAFLAHVCSQVLNRSPIITQEPLRAWRCAKPHHIAARRSSYAPRLKAKPSRDPNTKMRVALLCCAAAAEALTANSGGADWRYFAAGGVSAALRPQRARGAGNQAW